MVALMLVITMALMPRLLVAVGRSLFAHGHKVVGHGCRRRTRHGDASPTEEETKQHSREKACEAHAYCHFMPTGRCPNVPLVLH
jgi:hypothetical protein